MLTDLMEELGADVVPGVFEEIGTELVEIIRTTQTADGYGGFSNVEASITPLPIPCIYEPTSGNARFVEGGEWTMHKITMAAQFDGTVIDLKMTDKLKMLARNGTTERVFSIEGIKNFSGVYFEITCALDE